MTITPTDLPKGKTYKGIFSTEPALIFGFVTV